ncbi:hypothetical protein NHJ13051_006010 [Beauveria bassiana]
MYGLPSTHKGSHARVVRFEARFAIAWKVMIIEYLVELLEHRPVPSVRHAEKPGKEANGGPDDAIVDDFKGSGNGSECSFEDHFCIRVRLDKLLRKVRSWHIAHGLKPDIMSMSIYSGGRNQNPPDSVPAGYQNPRGLVFGQRRRISLSAISATSGNRAYG